jgi:hypothetical protein
LFDDWPYGQEELKIYFTWINISITDEYAIWRVGFKIRTQKHLCWTSWRPVLLLGLIQVGWHHVIVLFVSWVGSYYFRWRMACAYINIRSVSYSLFFSWLIVVIHGQTNNECALVGSGNRTCADSTDEELRTHIYWSSVWWRKTVLLSIGHLIC